jgi:hypothetical protein
VGIVDGAQVSRDDLDGEVLFAVEVVVERAFRDVRCLSEILDSRPAEALAAEDVLGVFHEPVTDCARRSRRRAHAFRSL